MTTTTRANRGKSSRVPAIVARYFGRNPGWLSYTDHPIITQEFRPGRGWSRTGYAKRVTVSWCRKLRARGVTHVTLTALGRDADFSITEILSRQAVTP